MKSKIFFFKKGLGGRVGGGFGCNRLREKERREERGERREGP